MGLLMGWPKGYGKKKELEKSRRLLETAREKVKELEDMQSRLEEEEVTFVEVVEDLEYGKEKVKESRECVEILKKQLEKREKMQKWLENLE